MPLVNMENEDYVGHWLSEMRNELDETNIRMIHDTLRANHFTTHAWHKTQRIRPSWTVIAFSGFDH